MRGLHAPEIPKGNVRPARPLGWARKTRCPQARVGKKRLKASVVPKDTAVADVNRDGVTAALGRPPVSQAAAADFVARPCAIGNHLEFADRGDGLVGTTNVLAAGGTLSLDLTSANGLASVILLNAHLSTLPDGLIGYREKRINMRRDKPGTELQVIVG